MSIRRRMEVEVAVVVAATSAPAAPPAPAAAAVVLANNYALTAAASNPWPNCVLSGDAGGWMGGV